MGFDFFVYGNIYRNSCWSEELTQSNPGGPPRSWRCRLSCTPRTFSTSEVSILLSLRTTSVLIQDCVALLLVLPMIFIMLVLVYRLTIPSLREPSSQENPSAADATINTAPARSIFIYFIARAKICINADSMIVRSGHQPALVNRFIILSTRIFQGCDCTHSMIPYIASISILSTPNIPGTHT